MALDPSPELWHVPPRRTALLTAVTLALAAGTAWLVARSNPDFQEVISPVQLTVSVVVPFFGVLGWHLRRRVALRSSEQPRTT